MPKLADIHWLAGYLEGEGSFMYNIKDKKIGTDIYTPIISVVSTDRDIINKAASILGCPVYGPYKYSEHKKYYWQTALRGRKAIGWMMTLYTLMGSRRRDKICEVIAHWKANTRIKLKSGPKPKGVYTNATSTHL